MPFRLGALLRFCGVSFHRRGLDRGPGGVGHAAPWALRPFGSASAVRGGGVAVSSQARLAVRDPQTGNTLPPGASGELWIHAPSRFTEYLEDPAATERAIDADGMFRTGDLARLAVTDFVYEARIGDAMRLGGFLVSPEEIEAVIQAQAGVAAVQVVAALSGGAEPVAIGFV